MKPEEMMLISAVRYALGRRSYIVPETCSFVASVKDKLSQHCIDIIIRDIGEGFEMYHRSGHLMGMECDEADWRVLLRRLKEGNGNGNDG